MTDPRYRNEYRTPTHLIECICAEDWRAMVRIGGKGTVEGAHILVGMLDDIVALDPSRTGACIMDISDVTKTPVRVQFVLGKWLLKNRKRVEQIALVGAKPWEQKIAKAVTKIARYEHIAILSTIPEALAFLGWNKAPLD